ncbi:MAG TPA: hypothetical protein VKR23_10395 [Gaiellaceae bacterium]|nr:hypothetical protein [Gaiellaceae bacterium]
MVKRMLVLGAAGLALAGVAASGAGAQTTSAFLCYSKFQTDPGVWPLAKTSPAIHDTAADLLALGYWQPYAEKSTPTNTEITGGYYLICNLPTSLNPMQSMVVTQKGALIPMSPKYIGEPGLYPEAA